MADKKQCDHKRRTGKLYKFGGSVTVYDQCASCGGDETVLYTIDNDAYYNRGVR